MATIDLLDAEASAYHDAYERNTVMRWDGPVHIRVPGGDALAAVLLGLLARNMRTRARYAVGEAQDGFSRIASEAEDLLLGLVRRG